MDAFISFWNQANVIATLLGMAGCVALICALIWPRSNFGRTVGGFAGKYVLLLGFLISLAALVSSLVYSNVIGFPPCLFCWYTRIFFYPQVVLFGMALIRRDRNILPYALALTGIGMAISAFHYLIESLQYSPIPCAAGGLSCLTRYVYEYGFITIPFMGLVGFVSLFLVILLARRRA